MYTPSLSTFQGKPTMICQSSNLYTIETTPQTPDVTYTTLLETLQKTSFSKHLSLQNYSHPASKIFSKLEVSEYQLTYFLNEDTPINPRARPAKQPQTLPEFIRLIRKWMATHYLTPDEVIAAAGLSKHSKSILYGHIPRDPNLKAVSIIMHTLGFPGGFKLTPLPATQEHNPLTNPLN
jgi:hypothetical protein